MSKAELLNFHIQRNENTSNQDKNKMILMDQDPTLAFDRNSDHPKIQQNGHFV